MLWFELIHDAELFLTVKRSDPSYPARGVRLALQLMSCMSWESALRTSNNAGRSSLGT